MDGIARTSIVSASRLFPQVIFEATKSTSVLEQNFDKINFKKLHQPTTAGSRQIDKFSLRGFYLGVVGEAFGHSLYRSVRDGQGVVGADFVRTADNQLVKAAVEFNDLDNLHKQHIICGSCQSIAALSTPYA